MRKPRFSGTFYPEDNEGLQEAIRSCFIQGPGAPPTSTKDKEAYGIVVPHGAYHISGPIAAWGYKELAESPEPDVIILLGGCRTTKKTTLSLQDWETPLGVVKNAKEVATHLQQLGIPVDEEAHNDQVLEVQLPFLQNIAPKTPVLFLTVGKDIPLQHLSSCIKEAQGSNSAWVVVSSDLLHYGEQFSYVPFVYNIQESIRELDRAAITCMQRMDPSMFLHHVQKTGATICGTHAIALALALLRDDCHASLLRYGQMPDNPKDVKNSVSYASIVFSE